MPLPPIPTQAADKVNISRQPKADLKKRPKRIEVEEVEEVTELAEGSTSFDVETDNSQSLADIAIEKMRAPSKSNKKSTANVVKSSPRVRKIPDDGIIRMFVLDTNVLMHDPSALFRFEEHDVYLPMMTLEELDNHKKGMSEVARNARTVSRSLDQLVANTSGVLEDGIPLNKLGNKDATGNLYFQVQLSSITLPDGLPTGKADNMILGVVRELQQSRKDRQVVLVSKDINMRIKARALGLPAEDYFNDQVLEDRDLMYSGVLQLPIDFWPKHGKDMESWSDTKSGTMFYRVTGPTVAQMMVNQFVYQENSDGGTPFYAQVREVQGRTALLQTLRDFSHQKNNVWSITARNREQNFAMNLLMNPDIDFVTLLGQAGTGKTLLALAAALEQVLDSKRYNEIIITRATVPVGEDIGFLPGTEEEKMQPWMGAYEFQHCIDVPWRVVLNEYIELAKSFGGTDGHKYVNGVLNGLAPKLRALEVEADRAKGKL